MISMSKKAVLGGAMMAATASLAFAGTAVAATPADATADYQLCGNVVDSSGNGVAGATVRGWLASDPGTYYNAIAATDSQGRYCVQGDFAMSTKVSFLGDKVYAQVVTPLPSPYTSATPNPLGPVDAAMFLAHIDDVYQSANGFDFVLS